jgi:hypothetical protein
VKKAHKITKDNAGDIFVKLDGDLEKLLQGMSRSIGYSGAVTVGLHKDAQAYRDTGAGLPSGHATNVVLVGAVHEYGLGTSPARRWLSRSLLKDRKKYKADTIKALVVLPEDQNKYKSMMGKIGKKAVDNVVDHVERNDIGMKAIKTATANRKGHTKVLIDSGHMLNQVSAKFINGEEIR